jgi:hypothetical protein
MVKRPHTVFQRRTPPPDSTACKMYKSSAHGSENRRSVASSSSVGHLLASCCCNPGSNSKGLYTRFSAEEITPLADDDQSRNGLHLRLPLPVARSRRNAVENHAARKGDSAHNPRKPEHRQIGQTACAVCPDYLRNSAINCSSDERISSCRCCNRDSSPKRDAFRTRSSALIRASTSRNCSRSLGGSGPSQLFCTNRQRIVSNSSGGGRVLNCSCASCASSSAAASSSVCP